MNNIANSMEIEKLDHTGVQKDLLARKTSQQDWSVTTARLCIATARGR